MGDTGASTRAQRRVRLASRIDRIPFVDKELFLLRQLARPGDTAIDVGAAGGIHTLVLARGVGRRGQVHAFEPRPGSAAIVRGLTRLAGMRQVTVNALALGAEEGVLTLRVPLVATMASSGEDAEGIRTIRTPVVRLDDHVQSAGIRRVDVMKLDAEGAEPDILAGATEVIDTHRPAVVSEVWAPRLAQFGYTVEHVEAFFRDRGYSVHRFDGVRLHAVSRIDEEDDDFVFLP